MNSPDTTKEQKIINDNEDCKMDDECLCDECIEQRRMEPYWYGWEYGID